MYLHQAVQRVLLGLEQPVVTEYDLFIRTGHLVREATCQGERIIRLPNEWDVHRNRRLVSKLIRERVLAPDDDFRSSVYRIVQSVTAGSAEEACCLADPFCYVSHLSAMHRYSLTDRAPLELHITTPARALWNQLRDAKMDEDLSAFSPRIEVPLLNKVGFKKKVRRREVAVHETRYPATPSDIRGEKARIATIGHVFVEMLEDPVLCGGIRHVLDVWEDHAKIWLDDIIAEVEKHPSKIVRVRAGYILEERLKVHDPVVDGWARDAQRGGSRKLDSDAPYAPIYSEKWMLSINV